MRSRSLSGKTWLAWVALCIGLLATFFGSLQVKQGIEQDLAHQFAFACDQVTLKIQERVAAYALILRGGRALFSASNTVDRDEWRAYVEALRAEHSVPGVQGVGFAQVIPTDQLATHIARIRDEGFPDYTVRPVGERAIYTSIVYLEPFRDRNLRAFGFDMYSEPVRRAAMEQARDTGEVALSGKVELVQETGEDVQAGTLIYVPVYRNGAPVDTLEQRRGALIGWVYSPYRMNDLMAGLLRDWANPEGKTISLHIYDGPQASPVSLLFNSNPAHSDELHSPLYQQRTMAFNGHQWLLVFDSVENFSGISYAPAWAVLTGGLALSALLFGLMLSLINEQSNAARISRLVDEITNREKLLKESEFRWKFAIEGPGDGLLDWNVTDNTAFFSPSWKKMFGYAEDEIGSGIAELWEHTHPEDSAKALATMQEHLDGKTPNYSNEYRIRCKDGSYKWIFDRGMVVNRGEDGKPLRMICTHRDITERKHADDKLRLAARVFSHAREGIMIIAADGAIIDVNAAFCDITGYSHDEILGQNPRLLGAGHQEEEFYAAMGRHLIENSSWYGELWNRRKNGEVYAVMQNVSAVKDAQGNTLQYVALFSDITPLKEHERKLEHIAQHDALTGLPNRVLLADRLQQSMAQARRRGKWLAVAFLDLDGFKAINDNHGHKAGDHLLVVVANNMEKTLREGDTIARLGGDEFVAVLFDLPDKESSEPMLIRLLAAAAEPVQFGEITLQVSASLGVTFYPQTQDVDADQLLRQADQAMYQAKQVGKSRYHIFDAAQDGSARGPSSESRP